MIVLEYLKANIVRVTANEEYTFEEIIVYIGLLRNASNDFVVPLRTKIIVVLGKLLLEENICVNSVEQFFSKIEELLQLSPSDGVLF